MDLIKIAKKIAEDIEIVTETEKPVEEKKEEKK